MKPLPLNVKRPKAEEIRYLPSKEMEKTFTIVRDPDVDFVLFVHTRKHGIKISHYPQTSFFSLLAIMLAEYDTYEKDNWIKLTLWSIHGLIMERVV